MNLILGDMLFKSLPGMDESPVFMREDLGLATATRHHQQKIVLFVSAMRHFRDALRRDGREVIYHEFESEPGSYF